MSTALTAVSAGCEGSEGWKPASKKERTRSAGGTGESSTQTRVQKAGNDRHDISKDVESSRRINVPWDILHSRFRDDLKTLQTQGCTSFIWTTDRLILRPCRPQDLEGVQKIKTEPLVQKTQLYGSPTKEDCREVFLNRYIRSSMPRLVVSHTGRCRDEYVFAITLKDPTSVSLRPAPDIRLSNYLKSAAGYIGNIALSLEAGRDSTALLPQPGHVFRHPTLADTKQGKLKGNMFYEIHPQLWGMGIMSEAFTEVLRFAMEDVGCMSVLCNPMTTNQASIKLCERSGMKFKGSDRNNDYRKPQAFYEISREEWAAIQRPNTMRDRYGGKRVCRWCMNFTLPEPEVGCEACGWAQYCSPACRQADWLRRGGHKDECAQKDGRSERQ